MQIYIFLNFFFVSVCDGRRQLVCSSLQCFVFHSALRTFQCSSRRELLLSLRTCSLSRFYHRIHLSSMSSIPLPEATNFELISIWSDEQRERHYRRSSPPSLPQTPFIPPIDSSLEMIMYLPAILLHIFNYFPFLS